MNEFAAKKLGEVVAFNRLGTDTITKAQAVLATALGEEQVADMAEKFRMYEEELLRVATDAAVIDITLAKAEKTEAKLREMRELYIGDNWDNATEIIEWSGFFIGAAIVHWALVRGVAQGLNNEGLLTLAEEGVNWNYEMLESAESELESRGQDKIE